MSVGRKATLRPRKPSLANALAAGRDAGKGWSSTMLRIGTRTVIAAGALVCAALAFVGAQRTGPAITAAMDAEAKAAIAQVGAAPVRARFSTASGWPSRHPELIGGEDLDEAVRAEVARSVAAIPGVGGIRWSDGTMIAESAPVPLTPMHCQEDVKALLRARTIRFEESSALMAPASKELLDEVAASLRPCLGAIIAITGHTDSSGPEPGNLELSRERARAVRQALIARGIPRDGMRARGLGSSQPVEGLDPADPANRRIEFSVISTAPIEPTPIDTPGPR